jgi:hypothetical protein
LSSFKIKIKQYLNIFLNDEFDVEAYRARNLSKF